MPRRSALRFDVWDLCSIIFAGLVLSFSILTALVPVNGIDAGDQIIVSILGLVPALLSLQRRVLLAAVDQRLSSRAPLILHDNNQSIWDAYRRAIEEPAERGIVRIVNGYHNREHESVVTSVADDEFYAFLARHSLAARDRGGHISVRLVVTAELPGIDEHCRRKFEHFAERNVAGDIEIRQLNHLQPFDLLLNVRDLLIMDVPEVYGHPVQGIGFEIRDTELHDAFTQWFDENLWRNAVPMILER